MSLTDTFAALAAKFLTADPSPQPALRVAYADPAEAVSLADFPCAVLCLAPQQDMTWSEMTLGQGRHDYTVAAFVFIGSRALTPLPQLHSMVLPWPKALADVLVADITLGGKVTLLGNDGPPGMYFRYQIGTWAWADGVYFGLRLLIPVTELHIQTMG